VTSELDLSKLVLHLRVEVVLHPQCTEYIVLLTKAMYLLCPLIDHLPEDLKNTRKSGWFDTWLHWRVLL
jgi:hypothetical protein